MKTADPITYKYDNYLVNERVIKSGTGPDQIKERIALVRRTLKQLYPDADTWTINTLRMTWFEAKLEREALRNAENELAHVVDKFPRIFFNEPLCKVCGKISGQMVPHGLGYSRRDMCQPFTGIGEHRQRTHTPDVAPASKGFQATYPVLQFLVALKNTGDKRDLQQHIDRYDTKLVPVTALKERLAARPLYSTITARVSSDLALSQVLKVGIHDFANTLYFLCPDSEPHNSAQLLQYVKVLHDVFDGREPVDDRPDTTVNDGEYLVLTDDEADDRCRESIAESLWAFKAEFLAKMTGFKPNVFEPMVAMCEDANAPIGALVSSTCGVDAFCAEAIKAEKTGRGHFLAGYDFIEHKVPPYFIYRTN